MLSSILAPKRLRAGSKVAIVAPSSPLLTEEVQAGIDIIRECGLEPVLGPCVKNLKTTKLHAGSVKDRVEELNWAFSHPNIAGVIGAVGGEGSAALLPYLDYETIRRSRKAFVGMSDLTSINAALLNKSGLISINGQTPSIRLDKGAKILHDDSESFKLTLELLKSDQPWGSRPFQFNPHFPRTVSPGKASGIAVGGNLDTFVHLIGTQYIPNLVNAILFVEDVHKSGEVISRELLHLRLAGALSQISGAVIGEFEDVPKRNDAKVPTIEDVIIEFFAQGSPCTMGYPFSHGPLTGPIPIGAMCSMDADSGEVLFDFCMST
jgi:muramoyltetrapeptide carboxypeptidase